MSASLKQLLLVLGVFIVCFTSKCDGTLYLKDGVIGIGLGLKKESNFCPPTSNATCACGLKKSKVIVEVPVCSFSHRWKVRCKPCDKVEPEDLCPRFKSCAKCYPHGGDSCQDCPPGKFGDWCLNDCTCLNGATCERDGKCTCPEHYEGRNCEKRKGCPAPEPALPPLQAAPNPPENPITIVYSCPPNHQLRGEAVSTCTKNNQWSSSPPTCALKCPLLTAPEDGHLQYSGTELVEGATAEVTCTTFHRLEGEKKLTCMAGGKWSSPLPVCVEYATCPNPADVANGNKSFPPETMVFSEWVIAETVFYKCHVGFLQLGATSIDCLANGTWSDEPPSCIKVSQITLDCHTLGSEVVSDVGAPVRISCPPECADAERRVWGTSIYRADSAVCQAAVHSAKLTNSGGMVEVINNGPYSHFTGSRANGVQSQSFEGRDKSFRFDTLPPSIQARATEECPKGMDKLQHNCVFISRWTKVEKVASAICTNLGLQLDIPRNEEEEGKLVQLLSARGISSIWIGKESSDLTNDSSNATVPGELECISAAVTAEGLLHENADCDSEQHYVCIEKLASTRLASCEDPGELENGNAVPVGRVNGVHYVGSSVVFACQTLHYLKGAQTISCTSKGTWSDAKPTCIKVDVCEDPPVPFGGNVIYYPPMKTASDQRAAVARSGFAGARMARLPTGLAMALPENRTQPAAARTGASTTPQPDAGSLPPGTHRVGSNAVYDCESRYYNLVGSKTRRCQSQGEWSGRPASCIPICGRSDSPRSPFIVNGNASEVGQWPWQAGLARYLPDYGRWFLLCGGSLLSERWVLTAAHCLTYAGTTLAIDPDKFQVYLGKYHRTDAKDDADVQVRKIHEIHIHPDYDPSLFDADIALIQLDLPVKLSSRAQPVCLPTEKTARENLAEGKKGVVTGWGMNENESYSETLQQAVLPVVSHVTCEQGYEDSELPLTVTDNMYCAGFAQGKSDACSGDSGGPMVFTDESSKNRTWVLEGIVSWGSPRGCGNPNQYGGFTTVSRFLEWIHLFV